MGKKLKHILDKPRFLWYLVRYLLALMVCGLFCGRERYKKLWLIAERGTDAQDNGYYFYRYMRKYHPEQNVRYVISGDSPDRRRFSEKDRLIRYRSFDHYLALALAEYKISTHIMGFTPDMWFFSELDRVMPQKGKIVFLQHGIIKDDIRWLFADRCHLDLFVCGARREAEEVTARYGYPPGVVRYLGLCRYDGLWRKEKGERSRIFLFMPTWRQYLKDTSLEAFRESSYFKGIQALLASEKISRLLEQWDCKLLFYPHQEILRYLSCFHSCFSSIVIGTPGSHTVQALLKRADCLITDYSSVFFDFAYMEKPIVYYQFDQEEYRDGHYSEGYFSYEKDGFGPVVTDTKALAEEMKRLLEGDGRMTPPYRERLKEYFVYRDRRNCRRNYEAIRDLKEHAVRKRIYCGEEHR